MPIRVLHVVTYMGRGGLETMIMNYYRQMDRDKVQFDFLVHRDFDADYDEEILALGGQIHRVPRLVPWSKSYKQALKDFFTAHPEYRIVHVHQDCLSSVALKAAKECGVEVRIAHSHSASQDKNIKFLIKQYYKKKIPANATRLFACGKEAGDWMFGGAPYEIVNNAIDARQYRVSADTRQRMRQALDISQEALVLGHVGRFNEVKNHTFLLDVFAEVRSRIPHAKLLLVGDGELRADIENKAQKLGIAEDVIFTGVRSDVADLMQAMDCFVFPSLYEGLPVTLVEAQAAGLPCVIADTIPPECKKTDLVEQVSLSASLSVWAERIMERAGSQKRDTYREICEAGFDITANAKWLQKEYEQEHANSKKK